MAGRLLPDFLPKNVINQILHTSHPSVSKNSAHKQCLLGQGAEIIGLEDFAHEKDGYRYLKSLEYKYKVKVSESVEYHCISTCYLSLFDFWKIQLIVNSNNFKSKTMSFQKATISCSK